LMNLVSARFETGLNLDSICLIWDEGLEDKHTVIDDVLDDRQAE